MLLWRIDTTESRENHVLGGADEGLFHMETEEKALAFARELCKLRSLSVLLGSLWSIQTGDRRTFDISEAGSIISEHKNSYDGGTTFYREAPVYMTAYKITPARMIPGEPYEPAKEEVLCQEQLYRGRKGNDTCFGSLTKLRQDGCRNIEPFMVRSSPIIAYPIEIELYNTPEEALASAKTHLKGYAGFNL